MKRVENRAPYARGYMVTQVAFPAQSRTEIEAVVANLMARNSDDYLAYAERGRLNMGPVPSRGVVVVNNTTDHDISLRFPRLKLQPGPNEVEDWLWDEALNDPIAGPDIWGLRGQPDGLMF